MAAPTAQSCASTTVRRLLADNGNRALKFAAIFEGVRPAHPDMTKSHFRKAVLRQMVLRGEVRTRETRSCRPKPLLRGLRAWKASVRRQTRASLVPLQSPPVLSSLQLTMKKVTEEHRGKERQVYGMRLKLNRASRRWMAEAGVSVAPRQRDATGAAVAAAPSLSATEAPSGTAAPPAASPLQ